MKSTNLLLADNNLSYLEMARKMLRFHDSAYSIDIVTSSEECLEKLLQNHYHLLLLSCNLDKGTGLDVLSQIVKTGLDIPVVFLLDEGKEHLIYDAIERGAFDYIIKASGHLNNLPVIVSKILEKRKAETKNRNYYDRSQLKEPAFNERAIDSNGNGNGQKHGEKNNFEAHDQIFNLTLIDEREADKETSTDPNDQVEEKTAILNHTARDTMRNGKGHFFLNKKGKFTVINKKMEEKLNFSETELLELTLEDLINADDIQKYYKWLADRDLDLKPENFKTSLFGKQGNPEAVEISIEPIRDRNNEITSYQGDIDFKSEISTSQLPTTGNFNQWSMIQDFRNLVSFSYESSLNHFLEKILQQTCRQFQFQRGTLALLDRRKKVFIKQVMIGYSTGNVNGLKVLEVPQDVISQIFANQFKVRVLYHDQELTKERKGFPAFEDRRLQKRDSKGQWHSNNVVLLNLTDKHNRTFGYISIDTPFNPLIPAREVFYNLELFSSMVSMAIENYYNFSILEKRNRRLKRLMVSGNIFKLNVSSNEILKESVWSIKFSMDFNLVLLGLINRTVDAMEVSAVACDDQVKSIQLKNLTFPRNEIRSLLKKEYRIGKSYLLTKPEPALNQLKDIYYAVKQNTNDSRNWNWWHILIVPIFDKNNKVIGFLLADDPVDGVLPSQEVVQTMEIFTTQISIALENRTTYLQLKTKLEAQQQNTFSLPDEKSDSNLIQLAEMFFK